MQEIHHVGIKIGDTFAEKIGIQSFFTVGSNVTNGYAVLQQYLEEADGQRPPLRGTVKVRIVKTQKAGIASAQYETDCDKLIVYKSCVVDDFFDLSTGIAGEILQKFINYRKKLAIVGDYSKYTSKALKDFIYESNNGNSIYFVPSIEEALLKLDSAE